MRERVQKAFLSASELFGNLGVIAHRVEEAARLLIDCFKSGRKLLVFGNGGSAADAQHIVAELVGRFSTDRRALPALALTTNTSNLTAIGNDYGFVHVFARQVDALVMRGDVVIGISTSGNSQNVIRAFEVAHARGARTVALTGGKECDLDRCSDLVLKVPSSVTPRIQECHIAIGHVLCQLVEEDLMKNGWEPCAPSSDPTLVVKGDKNNG